MIPFTDIRPWVDKHPLSTIALCFFVFYLSTPVTVLANYGSSNFCEERVLHDYEKPLRELRPRHRLPVEGVLPFAPRDLEIYREGFSRVIEAGDAFGYGFRTKGRSSDYTGALRRPLRLNWKVITSLRRVNSTNRKQQTVIERHRRIGEVRYVKRLKFLVSARPGIYRFSLAFRKANGHGLGFYSEYFRVVPSRVNVRLSVNGSLFHAAETVLSRVDNFGTDTLLIPGLKPPSSGVQRFEDGTWKGVARKPTTGVIDTEDFIYGGRAGSCLAFQVPEESSPGLYRFARWVNPFGPHHARLLTAEFSVLP